MSIFKIEINRISKVENHPNADRLDIIQLSGKDWSIVASRDKWKVGDKCIYFPIDSILPREIEEILFPLDSKVKLSNSRIRTIKLRGAISQGMIADLSTFNLQERVVGEDLTTLLKVTKYQPKEEFVGQKNTQTKKIKPFNNEHFRKYTDIENAKNHNTIFNEYDTVYVSSKLHGTSSRFGLLPTSINTIWKKLLHFINLLPEYEYVIGSRNVQYQDKPNSPSWYGENVYLEIFDKYKFKNILQPNEVIYGEIVGEGIQKGYMYDCRPGERKFYAYDVMINGKYLNYVEFKEYCTVNRIPMVPELYVGLFNKDLINKLKTGNDSLGNQEIREGVVVKSTVETICYIGRKVLKYINEDYLLKNQDKESVAH